MWEFADKHPVLFGWITIPLVITFCLCILLVATSGVKKLDDK